MRTLWKDKQKLQYSLQIGQIPLFDYYEDEEGNRYPIPNGKYELGYADPVEFYASISMSGGEAEVVEYGLSTESYSAVIISEKNAVPLTEGTLIWFQSAPEYQYNGDDMPFEINGEMVTGKFPVKKSADYIVMKKSSSLNFDKFILTAVNK